MVGCRLHSGSGALGCLDLTFFLESFSSEPSEEQSGCEENSQVSTQKVVDKHGKAYQLHQICSADC